MPAKETWHIVSLVVYCQPDKFSSAQLAIQAMAHAEIHTDDGHAKMVVTLEGSDTHAITEQMDAIRLLPGCVSVQMVFHQEDDNTTPITPENQQDIYYEA